MSVLLASMSFGRASFAFVARVSKRESSARHLSISLSEINAGVSRVNTLQSLLTKHGAPGSQGCAEKGDLMPVFLDSGGIDETPELVSTLMGVDEFMDLHPQLYPLARSKKTGNVVCALRRAFADDTSEWYENSSSAPWPIVEAQVGGPGMKLLSMNSENMMRRIICECDFSGENSELIDVYNDGLGNEAEPYEPGSVEKLGYGVDKYVLLKVGPFADIYESLALGHAKKNDESSALISAEAANNKISGFASTFLFYAKLLSSFPNREAEVRDAARICLRLPLPSIGLSIDEFREVAILGKIADDSDTDEEVMAKLQIMYEKIREHEQDEDPRSQASKSPEQAALDEANYLLDRVALSGGKWSKVRPELAKIYKSVGRDDMVAFVKPMDL